GDIDGTAFGGPVGNGRQTGRSVKQRAERSEAGEADRLTDLRHGHRRCRQQMPRPLEPSLTNVLMGRQPGGHAERANEMERRQAPPPGKRCDGQRLRIVPIDERHDVVQTSPRSLGTVFGNTRSSRGWSSEYIRLKMPPSIARYSVITGQSRF